MKVVTIIGGCGHVGIPLGVTLANANLKVNLVNSGKLPFIEEGAEEILKKSCRQKFSCND